jgi:hypothetical protein
MSAASASLRRPARVAVRARDAVAGVCLTAVVGLTVKLAFDAASGPTNTVHWSVGSRAYPGWLAGPLKGLGDHLTDQQFLVYMALLLGLWVAVHAVADRISLRWAVAAIALAHLAMALAPPIGLSDAFNYIGYGRLAVEHGLNPYTHQISEIPSDPVFAFATWPQWNNPYGPLSTLSFLPLAWLGVPQALWVVKVSVATAALGCVGLVGLCARELSRPVVPAMLFVGLNPQWLVYGVGGAHNDVFIVLLMLAGTLLLLRHRETLSGVALAGAAAVKLSGGLLLPFALLGARRPGALARSAAITGAVAYGGALVLWGPHLLRGVSQQRDLASLRSVPGLYAREIFGIETATQAMVTVGGAVFAVVAAALLWRTRHDRRWIENAGWATVALLLVLTWLMPWYLVWLLPLAALAGSERLRVTTIALAALLILLRAPTGLAFA